MCTVYSVQQHQQQQLWYYINLLMKWKCVYRHIRAAYAEFICVCPQCLQLSQMYNTIFSDFSALL